MRFLYLVLPLLFAASGLSGQVYLEIIEQNADLPFAKIVDQVEAHYQGQYKGRGSGYKQFKRWEFFHQYRLDDDGYVQNVGRRELDEFVSYRTFKRLPDDLNFDCSWEAVGGNAYERIASGHNSGLGRVNAVMLDPDDDNIVYVGTPAGGLWRSTSKGGWNTAAPNSSFWEPLTDGLPVLGVSGIAIDPTSPPGNRTIYILTGDGDGRDTRSIGVLKSFDNGSTWFETDLSWNLGESAYGYKLIMHPTDPQILFVVTTDGIYRTTDGGVNWTQEANGSFRDIEFRPGTPDTMYATTTSTVFRSIDGGDNWIPVTTPGCTISMTGLRLEIGVTPANPDYVYILSGGVPNDGMGDAIAGQFNGVYRSTNSGECFSLMSNTPNILGYPDDGSDARHQGGYDLAIAVSPTDENEIHTGGINNWKSTDGGVTWNNTTSWADNAAAPGDYTHADIHFLGFFGDELYCGSDGGVSVSTNNADDWEFISQGLRIMQFYRIGAFTDTDDYLMGGAQDNGLNELIDDGTGFGNVLHWEGADGFEVSPDPADDLVFGATQNGCLNRFSYPNGGFTDLTVFPGQSDSCGGAWLTPHMYDQVNDAVLAGYQDVWRSTDDGNNWNNISNGNIGGGFAAHIDIADNNTDYIYVSKSTRIYRSTDDGASWDDITTDLPVNPSSRFITYFTIDPNDEDRVWVTLSGFTNGTKVFFRDIANDVGWTNLTGSLPNLPANCIVYEAGSADGVYVGLDVGVYYRDNNLGDWVLFSNGLPNVIITELDINTTNNRIYAGTFGRSAWYSELISNCSDICLSCPHFDNFHSTPNTYSSEDCITSEAVVFNGTAITYEAENSVHLQEDFHVKSYENATFHATIESCSAAKPENLSIANLRSLSGFYVGKLPYQDSAEKNNEIHTKAVVQESKLSVFPNPVYQQLQLSFHNPQEAHLILRLYTITGQLAATLENGRKITAGNFSSTYDIGDLPGGTFILEAVAGKERYQLPIIVME